MVHVDEASSSSSKIKLVGETPSTFGWADISKRTRFIRLILNLTSELSRKKLNDFDAIRRHPSQEMIQYLAILSVLLQLLVIGKSSVSAALTDPELRAKCLQIEKLEGFAPISRVNKLVRDHLVAEIWQCAPLVESEVELRLGETEEPTRQALARFCKAAEDKKFAQADSSNIKPKSLAESATQLLELYRPSQEDHPSEVQVGESMRHLCVDILTHFEDLILYSNLASLYQSYDRTVASPLRAKTTGVLQAASLCRQYLTRQLQPIDIFLAYLREHYPASQIWTQLESGHTELFSRDTIADPSQTERLIEHLSAALQDIFSDTVSSKPLMDELSKLLDARLIIVDEHACSPQSLASREELISHYASKQQTRIELYLREQYSRQIQLCHSSGLGRIDSNYLTSGLAALDILRDEFDSMKDQLEAKTSIVEVLLQQVASQAETGDSLSQELDGFDSLEVGYLHKLEADYKAKLAEAVASAKDEETTCDRQEMDQLQAPLATEVDSGAKLEPKLISEANKLDVMRCRLDTKSRQYERLKQIMRQKCLIGVETFKLKERLRLLPELSRSELDLRDLISQAEEDFAQRQATQREQLLKESDLCVINGLESAFSRVVASLPSEIQNRLTELRLHVKLARGNPLNGRIEDQEIYSAVGAYNADHPGDLLFDNSQLVSDSNKLFQDNGLAKTHERLRGLAQVLIREIVSARLNQEQQQEELDSKTIDWLIIWRVLDRIVSFPWHDYHLQSPL